MSTSSSSGTATERRTARDTTPVERSPGGSTYAWPRLGELQSRRPAALRRYATRWLVRLTITALADALALVVLLGLAVWAAALPLAPSAARDLTALAAGHAHVVVTVMLLALALSGAYARRAREAGAGAVVQGTVLGVLLLVAPLFAGGGRAALLVAAVVGMTGGTGGLLVGRVGSALFLRRVWPGRQGAAPALFVGTRAGFRVLERSALDERGDYRVLGWVSPGTRRPPGALGGLTVLPQLIREHDVEAVVIGGSMHEERLRHVQGICRAAGCELLYPMEAVRVGGTRPRLVWLYDQPYLELGAPVLHAHALLVKRVMDVLGATLALVLLAPLLALIAAAVRLDSEGPVLFVQDRAGMGGRRFRMLKFRTMRTGADDEKAELAHLSATGDPRLFKIPDDPRVTRLGRFLRRWSLDELPQLWNVLRGDMSLVGPRPFFERDLLSYEEHHFHRLGAQPGITGLWQVSGRSEIVDFEEVVRLDRQYIEMWSLRLDLWILLRTVPAVLSRTGAY